MTRTTEAGDSMCALAGEHGGGSASPLQTFVWTTWSKGLQITHTAADVALVACVAVA